MSDVHTRFYQENQIETQKLLKRASRQKEKQKRPRISTAKVSSKASKHTKQKRSIIDLNYRSTERPGTTKHSKRRK
jgi:hypothetical protein